MEDIAKEIMGFVSENEKYRNHVESMFKFICSFSEHKDKERFWSEGPYAFMMQCSVCRNFVYGETNTSDGNDVHNMYSGEFGSHRNILEELTTEEKVLNYRYYDSPVRLCPKCIDYDSILKVDFEVVRDMKCKRRFCQDNGYRVHKLRRYCSPHPKVFYTYERFWWEFSTLYVCSGCEGIIE